MNNNLELLDQALDEASYYWLETNYPEIMVGIEEGLRNGASSTDIRRRVLQRTGREEMARRCEQAARHVVRIDGDIAFEELRAKNLAITKEWFGATPVKTGRRPEGKKVTVKEFVEASKTGIQPEQVETGLEALEKIKNK